MRRALFSLCALLALGTPARAGASAEADVVFRALSDEMARTRARLQMESLGKPYFVSYAVDDSTGVYLWATFGALKDARVSRTRLLKAGVRVGSPEFDNTHYVAKDFWSYRPPVEHVVSEDEYDALRFAAWTLTDEAYKSAVQKLSQKKAYQKVRMIKEEIPDLSRDPVQSLREDSAPASLDRPLWEGRLRKLSAIFRSYPDIQRSAVALSWAARRTYYLDSEGRRSVKNDDDFHLAVEASTQGEDGMDLSERRRVVFPGLGAAPDMPSLEAEVRSLASELTGLRKAPTLDAYIGPVLIEGQAAGEFFNQLLARNVSSPRPLWIEDEGLKDRFRAGELAGRLGLRVLSPFLSASDDPSLAEFDGAPLIGHYRFDDQGIPAQKVALVENGILKDLLMSRDPIKERRLSNGHGRASFFEFPTGRPGNMIVRAGKTLAADQLKSELLMQAREFGLEYGLIIRRIGEEDLQEEGDILSAPLLVYKAYVSDGREELVRGAQFSNVTLRALRDIIAASDKSRVYNYYQLGPYKASRGEVRASIVHPDILVAEMELKKNERKPEKFPYLRHPYFEK